MNERTKSILVVGIIFPIIIYSVIFCGLFFGNSKFDSEYYIRAEIYNTMIYQQSELIKNTQLIESISLNLPKFQGYIKTDDLVKFNSFINTLTGDPEGLLFVGSDNATPRPFHAKESSANLLRYEGRSGAFISAIGQAQKHFPSLIIDRYSIAIKPNTDRLIFEVVVVKSGLKE